MKTKVLLILMLLFTISTACTQTKAQRVNSGNRTEDGQMEFILVGIITSQDEANTLAIDLFFTREINPFSVKPQCFLINNQEFIKNSNQIQYTKNSRGIRLLVPVQENPIIGKAFDFSISNILSADNMELIPTSIKNIQSNEKYIYSIKEQQWKKS